MQARPEGETAEDRPTVPLKPFTGATVMVEAVLEPAFVKMLVGLDSMLKSSFVIVTVAVCVIPPLVPVTVTVYDAALPEHESVEVWEDPKTMLVGLNVQVAPPSGETDDDRLTVPVKPFTGVTVIVEVTVVPVVKLIVTGFAEIVKSLIVTVTVPE